ncbi:MAG: hypothetical protein HW388_1150 [Dehalococcoidia bacterium]|nr:hypothetical protein [Dehalococcoidia bacterium]
MSDLEKEYEYYRANQRVLAEEYNGKVLVIKGQEIIGVFDSELAAVEETKRTHPLGSFLVQRCATPEESKPQVFQSRVLIQ